MSNSSKILIHTALLCEAQPFIDYYKLKKTNLVPTLYENDNMIVAVLGMKKNQTKKHLAEIFTRFSIKKAFNIGIAGCSNTHIPIGALFCTTHTLSTIEKVDITTVNEPLNDVSQLKTLLVDMESSVFLDTATMHLNKTDCFVFKVVSDYCESKIPKKSFVTQLIFKNLPIIKEYL
jgi:nucleoside phosphorylase